jgi:sulfoxide reductase heme-binding subunit YedZ
MGQTGDSWRERGVYWAAWLWALLHVTWGVLQGPQPHGERPPPSAAVALANDLGFWALCWLAAALACTPLRRWTGATWPARWRRTLGLTAALWSLAHVLVWWVGEQGLQWSSTAAQFRAHLWLWPGLLALLGMALLAATSPAAAVRGLGAGRWRLVHRGVYAVALLAVAHYALRPWADPQHWLAFGLAITILLVARRSGPTDGAVRK